MHVAAAQIEDCLALAHIHVAAWQSAYASLFPAEYLAGLSLSEREAKWRSILHAGTSRTLVAKREGAAVGFVSFGHCGDEGALPTRGEVWALYVSPHAWSTGAGWSLWEAARVQMLHAGYEDVSLWVLSGNIRGLHFYKAVGFQCDSESEKYFEQGGVSLAEVRLVFGRMSANPSIERTPSSRLRRLTVAAHVER